LNKVVKQALSKAHTQSLCFFYPRLARVFKSAGSADLLSFGGVALSQTLRLFYWLLAYEGKKMGPVYLLIVGLKDISALFVCAK
jgi:hypothetical protein